MEFKLRPWTIDDLDSLMKYANNPKIAGNLTDAFPYPYTKEAGIKFIKMATGINPPHILAIEVNGEAAGGIGVHQEQDVYRINAEMGYWLAEPYWGKGIITEAIKQMVDYGFKNFDIQRIYARPYGHNKASQRVLEKAGFKQEAFFEKICIKNGEYYDLYVYAIRRNEIKKALF